MTATNLKLTAHYFQNKTKNTNKQHSTKQDVTFSS